MTTPQILVSIIFAGSLVAIFTEKINRTIVAMIAALLISVTGLVFKFYDSHQEIAAIDLETIGLLLGMMLLVSMLEPTGFFEYMALYAARFSKGKPVRLLIMLGTITTILSMFLDNVTTVVLIAPVTIMICEIIGLNPLPFLMSEALLSNTGGAATLIGDPPNVLIGSASGLSFNDFLINSLPVVLVCWLVALVMLRFLFRKELAVIPEKMDVLDSIKPGEVIKDKITLWKVLIVLMLAILTFFFQEVLNIIPALIALGAAAVAFLIVQPDVKAVFKRVDWSVLIFFACLFVMVGGLEAAGVLDYLTRALASFSGISPRWFGVLIIWVVAILSAVVDNVPITIAMIPVIQGLEQNGINVTPFWWALVFGAGFGGNATIIGSTANIVVTSLSERTRTPINSIVWNKRGLPIMIATCFVASVLYLLIY
jgi:Na+/H+ antiporter NhaD/arsenite permease-like protein